MPFYNVKKSFGNFSAEKLLTTSRKVITSLRGSTVFSDPKPSIDNLIDQAALLEKAISQGNNRGNITLSIVNGERANMLAMLSDLADYVSITANGNKKDILSAGFETTRHRGEAPLPAPIQHHEEIYAQQPDFLLLNWKLSIGI